MALPQAQIGRIDALSFDEYMKQYKASFYGHVSFLIFFLIYYLLDFLLGIDLMYALAMIVSSVPSSQTSKMLDAVIFTEMSMLISLLVLFSIFFLSFSFFKEIDKNPRQKAAEYHLLIGMATWVIINVFFRLMGPMLLQGHFHITLLIYDTIYAIITLLTTVPAFFLTAKIVAKLESSSLESTTTVILGYIVTGIVLTLINAFFVPLLLAWHPRFVTLTTPLYLGNFVSGTGIYAWIMSKEGMTEQEQLAPLRNEIFSSLQAGKTINITHLANTYQITPAKAMKVTQRARQELLRDHNLEILIIDHLVVSLPAFTEEIRKRLSNNQSIDISSWAQELGIQPLSLRQVIQSLITRGFLGNLFIQGWVLMPTPSGMAAPGATGPFHPAPGYPPPMGPASPTAFRPSPQYPSPPPASTSFPPPQPQGLPRSGPSQPNAPTTVPNTSRSTTVTKTCPSCKKAMPEANAKFCVYCGTKL